MGTGRGGSRRAGVGQDGVSVPVFWETGRVPGRGIHPLSGGSRGWRAEMSAALEGREGTPGTGDPLCPPGLLSPSYKGARKHLPAPRCSPRRWGRFVAPRVASGAPQGRGGGRSGWGAAAGSPRRVPPAPRLLRPPPPHSERAGSWGRRLERAISQSRIEMRLSGIAFRRPFNPISQNFLTD